MARRTFQMIDLVEIYVHWYAGRSQAQIAESLGLDRKTVRKYLAPVAAAGMMPGGPPVMTEADWRDRAASWFPALVDKGLRQVTWPAIDVHRDYITAQLAAGVTVSTIYQRLVDEQGLVASVASLRRWVGGNLPEEARRAQVRVLRPGSVEPGSEAQIDYGRLGVWTDPATGRRYTVQAIVMVLACSRYMFVRPVLRMDQEVGTEVLGVPEGSLRLLGRPAEAVIVDGVGQVGDLVGAFGLPIRAGGVDEDDVEVKVEQVGNRGEHLGGDLVQRHAQEVHPPVGLVVAEPRASLDGDSLGHPPGRGQLASRLQRPLGDQGEDDPLDRFAVQPAPLGDPADRRPDPQTLPQPVQGPGSTHPAGVQDLHLDVVGRGRGPRRRGGGPGLPPGGWSRDRGPAVGTPGGRG